MATPPEEAKTKKSAITAEDRSAALSTIRLAVARGKNKQAAAVSSSMEPAAKEEEDKPKPKPAAAEGNRIIRLPDWYIERLQKRGARKPKPLPEGLLDHNPKLREMVLARKEAANAYVDVEEDILMQVRDKGYAEVMLEYDDDGVVDFRIVPKPDDRT